MYVTEIEQDDKTFGIGRRRQRRQQQKIEKNGKWWKKMKTQVDALDIIRSL